MKSRKFTSQGVTSEFTPPLCSGKITVPLAAEGQLNTSGNNVEFVQQYVANLLKNAFPHFTDAQVRSK